MSEGVRLWCEDLVIFGHAERCCVLIAIYAIVVFHDRRIHAGWKWTKIQMWHVRCYVVGRAGYELFFLALALALALIILLLTTAGVRGGRMKTQLRASKFGHAPPPSSSPEVLSRVLSDSEIGPDDLVGSGGGQR